MPILRCHNRVTGYRTDNEPISEGVSPIEIELGFDPFLTYDDIEKEDYEIMEWIKCIDRLPDSHDVVLVSDGHNITVAQAYYNINDDFSWMIKRNKYDLWSEDGCEIRYWSHLPEAPEGPVPTDLVEKLI